jgi:hypothetical protein
LPSVSATRKAITDRIVRDAIAAYHQAERAKAEADANFGDAPELDPVMQVVINRFLDAERTLIRAVLSFKPEGGLKGQGYKPESSLWPARGVLCDGRYYMVSPDPDVSAGMKVGERSETNEQVMVLTVLPAADVDDVGTLADDPVYHPDGTRIWHINDATVFQDEDLEADDDDQAEAMVQERIPEPSKADEPEDPKPAPRRGSIWGPGDDVPRPILRQTMTIVPPWDNGSDATLEVIVLAEPGSDDDVTANRFDVPELAEAGWITNHMKGLAVYLRVLG